MFEGLKETFKAFSYRSVLKSNILSSSASFSPISSGSPAISGARTSSPSSAMVSNKNLATYYLRMQELKDYEVTELTNTVVGIYKDYIVNFFNKENDIITLKGSKEGSELLKHQNRINQIFKDLSIVEEIKTHLFEIIYNGQYCIKIDWDKENRKFVKHNLQNPYNVVTVIRKGETHCHLVVSRDGKILEVAPNAIFRFGQANLHLINDMNGEYFTDDKEDTLVKSYELAAGYPLYYNIANKVKEYLLKDQVVSLLSIKDLIQPLLLLIRVDKMTPPDEANKLALNTETLINKYSDISAILSANFSINDLIDSLINNIRVLPDYSSAVGDMNSIDLSKITNKIAEIRGEQEASKESLLISLGIPRSLFAGEVTKWEAIKSSERLNSKVNAYIIQIVDGLKQIASTLYYLITGQEFKVEDIECNLFTKTQVDYNTSISNADIINTLLSSINGILDSTQQFVNNNKLVEPTKYCNFVIDQLKVIDPDIMNFIGKEQVDELVKELIKSRSSEDSSGGGYGGYGGY